MSRNIHSVYILYFLGPFIPFLAVDLHQATAWCRRRRSPAARWMRRWSWSLWSSWCSDSSCTSDTLHCCTGMAPGDKQHDIFQQLLLQRRKRWWQDAFIQIYCLKPIAMAFTDLNPTVDSNTKTPNQGICFVRMLFVPAVEFHRLGESTAPFT